MTSGRPSGVGPQPERIKTGEPTDRGIEKTNSVVSQTRHHIRDRIQKRTVFDPRHQSATGIATDDRTVAGSDSTPYKPDTKLWWSDRPCQKGSRKACGLTQPTTLQARSLEDLKEQHELP
jgi:hypothetical protein